MCNQIKSGGENSVLTGISNFLTSRGCLVVNKDLNTMRSTLPAHDPINVFLNKYFVGAWFPMFVCVHSALVSAVKNETFNIANISTEEATSLVNIFNGQWSTTQNKLIITSDYPRWAHEFFGKWLDTCLASDNYARAGRRNRIPVSKTALPPVAPVGAPATPPTIEPVVAPKSAVPGVRAVTDGNTAAKPVDASAVCKNLNIRMHSRYG